MELHIYNLLEPWNRSLTKHLQLYASTFHSGCSWMKRLPIIVKMGSSSIIEQKLTRPVLPFCEIIYTLFTACWVLKDKNGHCLLSRGPLLKQPEVLTLPAGVIFNCTIGVGRWWSNPLLFQSPNNTIRPQRCATKNDFCRWSWSVWVVSIMDHGSTDQTDTFLTTFDSGHKSLNV